MGLNPGDITYGTIGLIAGYRNLALRPNRPDGANRGDAVLALAGRRGYRPNSAVGLNPRDGYIFGVVNIPNRTIGLHSGDGNIKRRCDRANSPRGLNPGQGKVSLSTGYRANSPVSLNPSDRNVKGRSNRSDRAFGLNAGNRYIKRRGDGANLCGGDNPGNRDRAFGLNRPNIPRCSYAREGDNNRRTSQ